MDNIGDIAYLLILLVIFLVNAIAGKNAKKRKEQQKGRPQEPTERESPRKTFDDILRELMGEGEQKQAPPEPKPATPPTREASKGQQTSGVKKKHTKLTYKNPYQEYLERNPHLAGKRKARIESVAALELEILDDGRPQERNQSEIDFDLKEAIIYSEILKRKY